MTPVSATFTTLEFSSDQAIDQIVFDSKDF